MGSAARGAAVGRQLFERSLRIEWLEDRSLLSLAPTGVDLSAASDSGVLDDDNLTNLDNSTAAAALQFEVSGTVAGATVAVYADGVALGTATATGETTTITTTGARDLADGVHAITARQTESGQTESGQTESADSPPLAITVDTEAPVQMTKLLAGDGAAGDYFGYSVAISGTTAIVGAEYDDDKGTNSGSAYIFEKTGSGWVQVAKLTAADGAADDYFGYSVSISGTRAIVGASLDDDKGTNSGSAYVFEETGSGWTQVAKLTAADGAASDYFGRSVSIDGTTAIVGASADDDKGDGSGSAYVFEETNSGWVQVAKLNAADGAADDRFGCSVAISGTTVIVGMYGDDDKGSSSGSARVFSVGAALAEDTGAAADDRVTADATSELVFAFYEPVYGQNSDVVVLDPNGDPVVPDSITGWSTYALVVAFTKPLSVDGPYTISFVDGAMTDAAGNALVPGEPLVVTLDTAGPRVVGIVVRSSGWSEAFLDSLDARGLGYAGVARLGYCVPDRAGQLDPITWTDLDASTLAAHWQAGVAAATAADKGQTAEDEAEEGQDDGPSSENGPSTNDDQQADGSLASTEDEGQAAGDEGNGSLVGPQLSGGDPSRRRAALRSRRAGEVSGCRPALAPQPASTAQTAATAPVEAAAAWESATAHDAVLGEDGAPADLLAGPIALAYDLAGARQSPRSARHRRTAQTAAVDLLLATGGLA